MQPVFDSRVSSGLLSPGFVNWPQHGADDMSLYNPEVTVFIVGANDAKNLPDGATRDPGWRAQYSALVEEMLTVIGGNGRAVYWVGAPVMADAAYSERVQGVNDVFREVAAKHADVTYIDAYITSLRLLRHVAGWQRCPSRDIRGRVRDWNDLEPALIGRVEELIDFVTQPSS